MFTLSAADGEGPDDHGENEEDDTKNEAVKNATGQMTVWTRRTQPASDSDDDDDDGGPLLGDLLARMVLASSKSSLPTGVCLQSGTVCPGRNYNRDFLPAQEEAEQPDVSKDVEAEAEAQNEADYVARVMDGQSCLLPFPYRVPQNLLENISVLLPFVPDASTLSGLLAAVRNENPFAPYLITIPREAIVSHFAKTCEFVPQTHHLLPVQIELTTTNTTGIPIPLGLKVTTQSPTSQTRKSKAERIEWGCKHSVNPFKSDESMGHIVSANSRSSAQTIHPLYRGNGAVIEGRSFLMWMTQNMGSIREYLKTKKAGPVYQIPVPDSQSKAVDNAVQWLAISEVRDLWLRLEDPRYAKLKAKLASYTKSSWFISPGNAPRSVQVPTTVFDDRLSEIESEIDADNNLMCIDSGITIELRPLRPNGWGAVEEWLQRRKALMIAPSVADPDLSEVFFEIQLIFIFNAAIPSNPAHMKYLKIGSASVPLAQ